MLSKVSWYVVHSSLFNDLVCKFVVDIQIFVAVITDERSIVIALWDDTVIFHPVFCMKYPYYLLILKTVED